MSKGKLVHLKVMVTVVWIGPSAVIMGIVIDSENKEQ